MLTSVPTAERIELLSTFAERVRDGHCGNGNRVRAGTVQVALCAIGKSFEMDGRPNPTYRCEGKYWLQLERLIEAYRRQDPPAQHKLAVPVSLVEHLQDLRKTSSSEKVITVCDMSTIAFYYLLRVGEYTGHRKKDRRRTKQFRACDITFYDRTHTIIPNTAPLTTLYTATKAAMHITNQKNGTRGSIISHDISLTKACPVRALARHVHSIMTHPQCKATDIISTYYSPTSKRPRPLQSSDINTMIKSAVRALHLDKKGFPPESVSSHSLRAGGAMAMHLNDIDRDKIRKQGRWSSDTFLMYIHEQILAFSAGISARMSQSIGWFNIEGPTLITPDEENSPQ
jgi:integrase